MFAGGLGNPNAISMILRCLAISDSFYKHITASLGVSCIKIGNMKCTKNCMTNEQLQNKVYMSFEYQFTMKSFDSCQLTDGGSASAETLLNSRGLLTARMWAVCSSDVR
jgi:hypothetical protein